MTKKRASEEANVSVTKKAKVSDAEFNGTVFKSMLKDPTKAMKGLEKFVSVAKNLPCPDLYDVVEGYIKISMECSDILKLLDAEKHVDSELMLIFHGLHAILLRTAGDLSLLSAAGTAVVKKLVSGHMKILGTSLHSENYRLVRQTLALLASMVSQGQDMAREVFSHFHFSQRLSSLARKRDKLGRPDVRMAYIQFALSFLVSGDGSTVAQVLETKDFLADIIGSGVKEDRLSSVHLILTTLQSRVVQNRAISKTQKVRFFTAGVLAHIASLYKWNGIVDASLDDSATEDSQEEDGKLLVRQLVHKFLLELCCSRKHGISFYDASLGTAGRLGNIVLLQFLVGLKQATEDELVAELVVKVLKDNPDMLPRYFKEAQFSFTPRAKSAWQDNVALLKKIYEAQPEVSKAFQTHELVPLPRLLSMVMVTSFPPICNKAFFTQGLNFPNTGVKLTTLSLVSFILRRAQMNIDHCLNPSTWQHSEVYTAASMEEFVQQYREVLSKALPDVHVIVSMWQSLPKKEKAVEEEDSQTEASHPLAHDEPEIIILKALILRVICLYQKVVPYLVSQSSFDFSKLLKGIMCEKGMKEEVPPVLQSQILQLALDLPANKFSWFRVQDSANAEKAGGEKSVFYLLLKMFVGSTNGHLMDSTRMLVLKVLRDSGVFEHTWQELEVWLNHLAQLTVAKQETVIQFVDQVLVRLMSNTYTYTDKAAGLVQEAAYLQASLSGQETDAASIPVSHIDDVLDMVDVIMDGSEDETLGPVLSDDLILQTFPFSALVPAALEARNSLPATLCGNDKDVVYVYLTEVLTDVLHSQRDPLPLCLALQQYDKELDTLRESRRAPSVVVEFYHYYLQWLPLQSQEKLFQTIKLSPSLNPQSFGAAIKRVYVKGPAAWTEDSFGNTLQKALLTMKASEIPVAVKQMLLYIRTTVENFHTFAKNVGSPMLGVFVGVLKGLVEKAQHLANEVEPTAVDSQEGSDLFLAVNVASGGKGARNEELLGVLSSIFKHPTLQSWFLALEMGTLPSHTLNAARLKHLCSQLSEGVLDMLQCSTPTLKQLGNLHLVKDYMQAICRSMLKELQSAATRKIQKQSCSTKGLLALHGFMDVEQLMEVVSALLLLPQAMLVTGGQDGTTGALGIYGRTILQVLSEDDRTLQLSQGHLRNLASLLPFCSGDSLANFILLALHKEPSGARLVPVEVLLHCLTQHSSTTLGIAALLLENCSTHCLQFELWYLEPTSQERVVASMDEFLPLINTYLKAVIEQDPLRSNGVQRAALVALREALFPTLCTSILSGERNDVHADQVEVLCNLVKLAVNANDVSELIDGLPEVLQRPDGPESWGLIDCITEKLADTSELLMWTRSLIAAALQCLVARFKTNKLEEPTGDEEASDGDEEGQILQRLQNLVTSLEDITASDWNSFVKTGLKHRYRNYSFLDTFNYLLGLMYGSSELPKDLLPLSTIHMMITSHSLFLSSLLVTEDTSLNNSKSKDALVSVLLTLVQKCPSVCQSSHFVLLLGAYGATLSLTDQKLFLLLQEYEKNNLSLADSQSLLWGPAAVLHHKARKSLGTSLWQQPSCEDLLALLDPKQMLNTVNRFPLNRRLLPQEAKELLFTIEGDFSSLYDPCFLLPLFSFLLKPEAVVDCRRFVSSHALGVTFAALSSYDSRMRAAAYQVLGSFYHHLDAARFGEQRQLLYLMDTVRNGIHQQNFRLPFLQVSYISKVVQHMLKPEEHMYLIINKFLLAHQSLDLKKVPGFFKLFYSFDLEHKAERAWILSVLQEGLVDHHCYRLCEQQAIFQILMSFCSSPLCDDSTQALILQVFQRAAHVTKAAYEFVTVHGMLSWVIQLVERRFLNGRMLTSVVDLVHVLWFTNLGQKDKESHDRNQGDIAKHLPLPLISEFLFALSAILRHFPGSASASQMTRFLQTLSSVMKHRRTAQGAVKNDDCRKVHEQTLSATTALTLLHSWAKLTQDALLLSDLQEVLKQQNVKELLGVVKDKSGIRSPAQHSRKLGDGEQQQEVEQRDKATLKDSEPHLRHILTHVSPSLPPPTAGLLVKWMLRSLARGEPDPSCLRSVLRWLQTPVPSCQEVVQAVLTDVSVRPDLLRLYHQTCEMDILQPFTNIMLRLLEAQGVGDAGLHQAVLSACLPSAEENDSKNEAGLLLLSLYIHEVWSGAEAPVLFLSHIRLVTGVRERGLGRRSVTETAVSAICQAAAAGINATS